MSQASPSLSPQKQSTELCVEQKTFSTNLLVFRKITHNPTDTAQFSRVYRFQELMLRQGLTDFRKMGQGICKFPKTIYFQV
jgi:hypothetical protein